MKVRFEKVVVPCVVNDITLWHLEHGWLWDVICVERSTFNVQRIGVFFATLLCGDGCIVHFSMADGVKVHWSSILAAMRKGVRMVAGYGNVIYATIPSENTALIRVAIRLGFGLVGDGGFLRDGKEIVLLKYYPGKNAILKSKV